jgi:ATP-dependent protease ClpP protease subunit
MDKFIARYTDKNGFKRSFAFDKSRYNQEQAEEALRDKGIKNFFFFFEPNEPTPFKDGIHFSGEVGFDITMDNLMPYVDQGTPIYIDTFGGDLFEGWKIHDAIKESGKNPKITALGTIASSGIQILLSTSKENRDMTDNSRLLIHNPWTWEMGDDEQMQRTANDLRLEKERLAIFYANIAEKDKQFMLDLMKQERWIHKDEAKELNFINNENEMNKEQEAKLDALSDGINKIANGIKNLFIKPVKNIMIQDVNGTEIDFGENVTTVEEIAVGDTATVNGEPANGEYVLEDGSVYIFEAGALMEIREPETQEENELATENETLREENMALQAKLTEKENQYNELVTKSSTLENDLKEIQKQFKDFKNQFSDEKQELNTLETESKKKKKFSYKK